MLQEVVRHSAERFGRVLVMPNLKPPVLTVQDALTYRQQILSSLPNDSTFNPLMALYLTENTQADDIALAAKTDTVLSYKLYPAGATTNSKAGVQSMTAIMPLLETMAKHEIVLCIHGEATDPHIDVFDREKTFIEHSLQFITQEIPELKIVLEHISTTEGIQFVESGNNHIAGSLTAHHLLENRNAMFQGGINPHHYCLPILKRDTHQKSLIQAAIGGNPKFFAGTDSAPHLQQDKESACGCAGMYTAHAAIELYAEVFECHQALEKLEAFASHHGAAFYGLTPNTETITLQQQEWQVPAHYFSPPVVPFRAQKNIRWKLK